MNTTSQLAYQRLAYNASKSVICLSPSHNGCRLTSSCAMSAARAAASAAQATGARGLAAGAAAAGAAPGGAAAARLLRLRFGGALDSPAHRCGPLTMSLAASASSTCSVFAAAQAYVGLGKLYCAHSHASAGLQQGARTHRRTGCCSALPPPWPWQPPWAGRAWPWARRAPSSPPCPAPGRRPTAWPNVTRPPLTSLSRTGPM